MPKRIATRLWVLLAPLFLLGCAANIELMGGRIDPDLLADGVFEGAYGTRPLKTTVRVTVEDRRLVAVELLEHRHSHGEPEEEIIMRMVREQSTVVEPIEGAVARSRSLMNAVERALRASRRKARDG